MKIKEFQTQLLNETDSRLRKPIEDQYRKLVENLSEGVVLTTMFGDILEANKAYQNMLGYSLTELRNHNVQQLTPAKWHELEKQKIAEAMTQNYVHYEKVYLRKDGTLVSTGITAWIIKDRKDNPVGTGTIITRLP
jgi:PAS domain S-box-containing protein